MHSDSEFLPSQSFILMPKHGPMVDVAFEKLAAAAPHESALGTETRANYANIIMDFSFWYLSGAATPTSLR
jgi:hypothetical protein